MSDASPPIAERPFYSRPHDPRLCDYMVCEGEQGGEASTVAFELNVPDAADAFDDSETGELSRTIIGAAEMRAPAKR